MNGKWHPIIPRWQAIVGGWVVIPVLWLISNAASPMPMTWAEVLFCLVTWPFAVAGVFRLDRWLVEA